MVHRAVCKLKSGEGTSGGIGHETGGRGVTEEAHAHALDAPEDDFASLSVELAREGIALAVYDGYGDYSWEIVYGLGGLEPQETTSEHDGLRWSRLQRSSIKEKRGLREEKHSQHNLSSRGVRRTL